MTTVAHPTRTLDLVPAPVPTVLTTPVGVVQMANGITRAPIILVSAPGHMIGNRKLVETYQEKGRGDLPPWYKEWFEILGPLYHCEILETPAQLAAFFRGAVTDLSRPRVGFIANTVLSLHSGYTVGAVPPACAARRHDRRFKDDVEIELKRLEERRKATRKKAQAVVSANADEDETVQETAAMSRDRTVFGLTAPTYRTLPDGSHLLSRPTRQIARDGLTCPRCGRVVRTSGKEMDAADATTLRKGGLATARCEWCGEALGQMAREQDNVQDRKLPLFRSSDWLHSRATTTSRVPITIGPDGEVIRRPRFPLPPGARVEWRAEERLSIPWGERPTSNPRYALGRLIGKRYKGWVDVYIADECHDYKGRATAIGAAFGALVAAARATVALTGTLFGGYASTLYTLLLRLGNVPVIQEYGWDDEQRFVVENGIVMEITRETQRLSAAGHFSGEAKVETDQRELPGITARLGATVQNHAIQVLLRHMGYNLVDYHEDCVLLEMPDDIAQSYDVLVDYWKDQLRRVKTENPQVLQAVLSRYLQSTLSFPYQPWNERKYKDVGDIDLTVPAETELPHHTELAAFCATRVQNGRRVLIYAQHTGDDDILADVAAKVSRISARDHGTSLKVAVLRSTTVKPGERAAWFRQQEQDGVQVVLCYPS